MAASSHSWLGDLAAFDWSKSQWTAALCRVPALLLNLTLGLALHQPLAGVVAAGAALSIGMAASRRIGGSHLGAMAATIGAMALSAWVGTLAGNSAWFYPLTTATWGLVFAFLTVYEDDVGWVAMQAVIALVIAGGFPSHGYAALARSGAIMAGGLVQAGMLVSIDLAGRRLLAGRRASALGTGPSPKPFNWEEFSRSFTLTSKATPYAVRLALTLVLAEETARHLPLGNGYWLPMTTIIVLKPDFYRTYSGAVQRVLGTFLGVIVASLISHLFHPSPGWLVFFVALFSYGCFAFLKVNSALFAAALTGYIVFLVGTTGLPATNITWHRLIHTMLGSALALSSRMLGLIFRLSGIFGEKSG